MPSKKIFMTAAAMLAMCCTASAVLSASEPSGRNGYYRYPSVHGDTVVFTSEGDLWTVALHGGTARRLTSNSGVESLARISNDGRQVAFIGQYEGPSEVYTVPLAGGVPERRTWNGDSVPAAWAPDGRLMVSTNRFSTLPDPKLVLLDDHGGREIVPLAEGAQAAYSSDGRTLYFTRWHKQPSATKRYQGGYNETLWRFDGRGEAVPLTADWAGTSTNPMFWNQRLYFLSDRDGVMNVFSMDAQGGGVRQESHQRGFDIASASLSEGRIVYACGGDLWSLDLKTGHEEIIPISMVSDYDQLRDHWVKTPLNYLTSVHISADGGRAIFTARGESLHAAGEERPHHQGCGQSGRALSRSALSARRKKRRGAFDGKRRNRILEVSRQRRRRAGTVDAQFQGVALGRRALARRQVAGASGQGSAVVDLRYRDPPG